MDQLYYIFMIPMFFYIALKKLIFLLVLEMIDLIFPENDAFITYLYKTIKNFKCL